MPYLKTYLLVFYLFFFVQFTSFSNSDSTKWKQSTEILNTIKNNESIFPEKEFNILDYGAIADEKTLNTLAINKTIYICSQEGGGVVVIPDGKFLTGAIHLKNNVNLHISKNAELIFSTNPSDYLPVVKTSWEGIDCYNYSPLIYAYNQTNIAITGKGKLNGQANRTNWWKWKGRRDYGWNSGENSQLNANARPLLDTFNKNQTPLEKRVMGKDGYLRPQFIQVYKCKNILLEDFTIENSPFWIIHPIASENITARGLNINSNGPNNDGCNPESCKNVLIEKCTFNTGDDCIALKSGRDEDGREAATPIENVIIRDCLMKNGHGGVVIGSEVSGGVKNIFVENCNMNSPELDRAIRIKTNDNRGGIIEDVFIRNIEVGEVTEAVVKINCSYDPSEGNGDHKPLVRNIYISDIKSQKASYALFFQGIKSYNCIKNIYIKNCIFNGVERKNRIYFVENLQFQNVKVNRKLIDPEKTN